MREGPAETKGAAVQPVKLHIQQMFAQNLLCELFVFCQW